MAFVLGNRLDTDRPARGRAAPPVSPADRRRFRGTPGVAPAFVFPARTAGMATDPTAESLLTSEPLAAFLATTTDDRPHVAPVWYRYDDGTVEVLITGKKLENVRANPRVALSVQKDRAGVPEWTVTALGTATIVDDPGETEAAIRRINRRYGVDEDAWDDNTLVRIDVGSTSRRVY